MSEQKPQKKEKEKQAKENDVPDDFQTRIKTAIGKTGFLLEKHIADILEANSWTVINNRYYIDSIANVPREMDIVAYKVKKYEDTLHCITLIISCKKSEGRDWVFLTKENYSTNLNINLLPLTKGTNSKIMEVTEFQKKWEESVKSDIDFDDSLQKIFYLQHNVYAFQEIENDKPKNDDTIFKSIDSLIKAVNFEINSLFKRKEAAVFYTFNLLTVLDGNMYEAYIHDDRSDVSKIGEIKYVNRFIVDNKEDFYRLQFCTKDFFPKLLESFNQYFLYEHNLFKQRIDDYYENCLENDLYIHIFAKELENEITRYAKRYLPQKSESIGTLYLNYDTSQNMLNLYLSITDDEAEILNSKEYFNGLVKKSLKTHFHYSGQFQFTHFVYSDIPF